MPKPVSFRWSEEFVARIDSAAGHVSRSKWIRLVLEAELERLRVQEDVRGLIAHHEANPKPSEQVWADAEKRVAARTGLRRPSSSPSLDRFKS